ncbi:MAG: MerR family transcriptional regulator [Sutterellaceae bacterium]|nr:MerR family transcriptional regulator [Sutterellaceae bacterium]
MPDFTQPDQQFSLQEVAQHCGLAPYIIRYWEIHFPQLAGVSGGTKSGYSSNDVALIWRIKKLLYVDHLTIDQAKAQLVAEQAFPVQYPGVVAGQTATAPAREVEQSAPEVKAEPEPAPVVEEVAQPVQEPAAPVVDEPVAQEPVATPVAPAVTQPQTIEVVKEVVKEVYKVPEETLAELQQLRARVESLTQEVATLTSGKEALAQENEELKYQLSQYESAKAGIDAAQSTLAKENAYLKTTMSDVLSQLVEVSASLSKK